MEKGDEYKREEKGRDGGAYKYHTGSISCYVGLQMFRLRS